MKILTMLKMSKVKPWSNNSLHGLLMIEWNEGDLHVGTMSLVLKNILNIKQHYNTSQIVNTLDIKLIQSWNGNYKACFDSEKRTQNFVLMISGEGSYIKERVVSPRSSHEHCHGILWHPHLSLISMDR